MINRPNTMTRQQFFPLFVIMLAAGMAGYFSWPFEPPAYAVAILAASTAGFAWRMPWGWQVARLRPILVLAHAVFLGALWAQAMSHYQLHKWADVPIVVAGEERATAARVMWSEPRIRGSLVDVEIAAEGKPYRLRLFGKKPMAARLRPGCLADMVVQIKPIAAPFADNSYDPRLRQFFNGRKGQGFIRQLGRIRCPERRKWGAHLADLRLHVAAQFRHTLDPPYGGVAAALVTGIRGGISADSRPLFRDSGLAHMLAISGLHMALCAGSFFAVLRLAAAVWPWLVHRYDTRRLSAALAIIAGLGYLALSGASFATQRAFVMTGIMFLAILLGRAGLTLRNLAWAALVILVWQPAAVMQAGFQMSFAAVMALIAYYEYWQSRDRVTIYVAGRRFGGRVFAAARRYLWALVLTSLIAGAVTGFLAAYHFGQIGRFGLLANVLAMPIFASLVMPMAAISLLLLPLGLSAAPMAVMQVGLTAILSIAERVTGFSASVAYFGPSPSWVLPCAWVGLISLCLAKAKLRWLGLAAMILAVAMLGRAERPLVSVVDGGQIIVVRQASGEMLMVSHPGQWGGNLYHGDLVRRYWQAAQAEADCFAGQPGHALCGYRLANGQRLALVRYARGLTRACATYDVVIARRVSARYPCRALLLDQARLTDGQHFSLYQGELGFRVHTKAPAGRARLWHDDVK